MSSPSSLKDDTVVYTKEQREASLAKVARPLDGLTPLELRLRGIEYAWTRGLTSAEDRRAFELGAVLAQDPEHPQVDLQGLTEAERDYLRKEINNRWRQPKLMYIVIVICSICAAIQGMDETVINGAQLFFFPQFGIENHQQRQGITNGAPYLACALLGCWLTIPLNNFLGRRGVILFGAVLSIIACLWQAFVGTWWHMVIARLALGLAIGPMSATVPIFAAETTPPKIRGAFCMQWQMWTAFGILVGYCSDLMFFRVQDHFGIIGLKWRLMMASPLFPAIIVASAVLIAPESPRWLMQKDRHCAAYKALCRLRFCKVQAARDIFRMYVGLEEEKKLGVGIEQGSGIRAVGRKFGELISVSRNRRALYASELVMFMQQFCGINVIAYYSSVIFVDAGFSHVDALGSSAGFGAVNWIFAVPALFLIDKLGRRKLLLMTFPIMSLMLFYTGWSFLFTDTKVRVANVSAGIYLFCAVYSGGPGPVPFTYSAEAYPLAVRTYGMSLATATTWLFNFILSFTWPSLQKAFKPQGAFSWYAAWNLVGTALTFVLVRETKGKSLEELDQVFSTSTGAFFAERRRELSCSFQRRVLRRKVVSGPSGDSEGQEGNNEN
ncbi:MAG: hypothetical protein M1828_005634 [Chrysothrix sp. TS-e1954]|nr:MAG: hypothetical protein M1828_005634 [Chrysothrix sp. TS-e1954]